MTGEAISLAEYAAGRDRLFASLVARLEADDRCSGAWLAGAHGRNEDDEWSDFDFHVAVRDDSLDAILADPRPIFALPGEVLLVQANFPSDSMPRGRFWLVVYPGPVQVDWNVGPASAAARPKDSILLFEKQPIPFAANAAPLAEEELGDTAQKALEFFWAMSPIAVKYAARGWTRRAVQQEALLSAAFERLWRLAHSRRLRSQDAYDQNRPPDPEMLAARPEFGPEIDPAETLRVIQAYCDAVESLHPALVRLGATIPERMPTEVRVLLALASHEASKGVVRPGTGSIR